MQIANPSALRRFARTALCIAGCALIFPASLPAGAQSAEISGAVLDMQGVAVAAARVKLLNAAGTLLRETESDQRGYYGFSGLDPGQYKLTAEISLFAPTSSVVTLSVGEHAYIELQFQQIASLRQAIIVTGSSVPSALTPDPS